MMFFKLPRKAVITSEENEKILAFLNTKGATICPPMFSSELKELNTAREELWRSMTAEERYKAGLSKHRPRRLKKKSLSHDEIKERNRKYSRDYYYRQKNKIIRKIAC